MSGPSWIAHYRITSKIGEGGMGAVYRATDTRLNRDVALKILPEAFATDPDRIARFSREAQVLAALNHPNIAMIFGIEEGALVMELVEGATLDGLISKGPIPAEQALLLARQIAAALEAAHEKGIVHRDLKPANIKFTRDEKLKVLDFGLAKALDEEGPRTGNLTDSPTLTIGATRTGMIVGTPGYMSPEQARGRAVGKQADIWAFGVVLYEMLTGKHLFAGATISDSIASVLRHDPDFDAIPAELRPLLRKCLERDPQKRLRDIGDMELLVGETPASVPVRRNWWWPAIAMLATVAAATVSVIHFREKPVAPLPVQLEMVGPPGIRLNDLSVSPNGRQIVLTGIGKDLKSQLWLRNLESLDFHLLAGTDGALEPFWSPDSRFVVFRAEGKLKKIAITGGTPEILCDTRGGGFTTGAWNREGAILFASTAEGLMRVPASGGAPAPVTAPQGASPQYYHRRPTFLPDGRRFLYFSTAPGDTSGGVFVGSLDLPPDRQSSKRLLTMPTSPIFVSTNDAPGGKLLYLREGALLAQSFDIQRLELVGDPVQLAHDVKTVGTYGFFSVSDNGVLVYTTSREGGSELTWYDRRGKQLGTVSDAGMIQSLTLSPDGATAAVTRGANRDIWLMDFQRSTNTRLTFNPADDGSPVWSPDGKEIIFASNAEGRWNICRKPLTGSMEERVLLSSKEIKFPVSWSRDGRFLLYTVDTPQGNDLWFLPLEGDGKPAPFITSPFHEVDGAFSPDGHWIAYSSNESGTFEIYIRPFPINSSGGARWQVSNSGGLTPRWRSDGKELFFARRDRQLMSVDVTVNPAFRIGVPKPVLEQRVPAAGRRWDVSGDGQRFLFLRTEELNAPAVPFTAVLNWHVLKY